jgi:hypothetical protein
MKLVSAYLFFTGMVLLIFGMIGFTAGAHSGDVLWHEREIRNVAFESSSLDSKRKTKIEQEFDMLNRWVWNLKDTADNAAGASLLIGSVNVILGLYLNAKAKKNGPFF